MLTIQLRESEPLSIYEQPGSALGTHSSLVTAVASPASAAWIVLACVAQMYDFVPLLAARAAALNFGFMLERQAPLLAKAAA